jgi:hypothetical protein
LVQPVPPSAVTRFDETLRSVADGPEELFPVRLSRACAEFLAADGAGLSLFTGELRIPIGASSEDATLVERLQFTLGEGPCLEAAQAHDIVVAGPEALASTWPLFARELTARTPFRAVVTMPLDVSDTLRGALDVYFTDPVRLPALALVDVLAVQSGTVRALSAANAPDAEAATSWNGLLGHARMEVWMAMGMTMAETGATAPAALDALRTDAVERGATVDEVAAALVRAGHGPDGRSR